MIWINERKVYLKVAFLVPSLYIVYSHAELADVGYLCKNKQLFPPFKVKFSLKFYIHRKICIHHSLWLKPASRPWRSMLSGSRSHLPVIFMLPRGTTLLLTGPLSPELCIYVTSLVVQTVKHLSTMWETWVRSLGQEVPWRRKWQTTPVCLHSIKIISMQLYKISLNM